MGIILIIRHLEKFKHFRGTSEFLLIFGDNTFAWEVSKAYSCPPESMGPPIYVFVLTLF